MNGQGVSGVSGFLARSPLAMCHMYYFIHKKISERSPAWFKNDIFIGGGWPKTPKPLKPLGLGRLGTFSPTPYARPCARGRLAAPHTPPRRSCPLSRGRMGRNATSAIRPSAGSPCSVYAIAHPSIHRGHLRPCVPGGLT